jgi:drug/metabolite transporter (DMT)-like permease
LTTFVFLAVLLAALCHAGWNVLIKAGLDPLATTTLTSIASGMVALPLLIIAGVPDAAAWIWLGTSVVIHLFYFAGLIESYRAGDLGQVYPIARGAAPLMTAGLAALAVGEKLSATGWSGIVLLVLGVCLLSARGGRDLARVDRKAVGFALFTAITICAYSVVDGIGARLSQNPAAYVLGLFVGIALVLPPYAYLRAGAGVFKPMPIFWRRGLVGGGMQVFSYGVALWAMTVAPIALVAALRETSVLFGSLIAVVALREPLRPTRIAAALFIVGGLVLIRLQ